MQYWLREIAQSSVHETTFTSYGLLVRLYVLPGLGKRRLRALQAQHIRSWLNGLRTTCQCCVQGNSPRYGTRLTVMTRPPAGG
jgi:hypothetical protein